MKKIIRKMIEGANNHHVYEMANAVYKLLSQFADKFNCHFNWRDLREHITEGDNGDDKVMENLNLTKSEKQSIREALEGYGSQMNEIGCGDDYGSEYLELVERFW